MILTACADSAIRVLDATTGVVQFSLQGHSGSVDHMHFDGQTVVSIGSDR